MLNNGWIVVFTWTWYNTWVSNLVFISDLRLEHLVFTSKDLDQIKIIDFNISTKLKLECTSWKPMNSVYELSF